MQLATRIATRLQCRCGVEVHEHWPDSAARPDLRGGAASDLVANRWLPDMEPLPSIDIADDAPDHFLVCRDATGVAGVVGLEKYGKVALLRSLVVTGQHMGRGLGRRLVGAAEELAANLDVRSIYLLTANARAFFEHMGFRSVDRNEAPPAIQATWEFCSPCPATAVLMMKP